MNVNGALWGVTAIALTGYLGAVIYQGNPGKLIDELAKEQGFIEFLIALAAINALVESRTVGKVAWPVVSIAVVAGAMMFLSRSGVSDALRDYGTGKASLFETFGKVFGGAPA